MRDFRSPIGRTILAVGFVYFALSFFMFRDVIASIPAVWRGEVVINGDELVPFFNPYSQLLDQAAGKYNELTNGYEFRVRYAFLTTWVRYYKILPIAIPLVIPGITWVAYLSVAWFLSRILPRSMELGAYQMTAGPVLLIFLVLAYSKITHFYTLALGFSMFLVAAVLMTYALIFAVRRPYRYILIACLIILFNPAVHYLVLGALVQAFTVGGLLFLEAVRWLRGGLLSKLLRRAEWRAAVARVRTGWRTLLHEPLAVRCIVSLVLLGIVTLLPYALFVKYVALRGVPNLAETVPADYYFIADASISLEHVLAFDMAGIMDKMMTGDYLSQVPRYNNAIYMVLLFAPLLFNRIRRSIFDTAKLGQFLFVSYLLILFSMWATLGYSGPDGLPTFHRTIALISNLAYGTQTVLGDLVVSLTGTVVQVLRFPHRFELILFMMTCIILPIPLIWMQVRLAAWFARFSNPRLVQALPGVMLVLFMVPLLSNAEYRDTFFSGNFEDFLTPYPVGKLEEVKRVLQRMPEGKTVVLPPTESAKIILDENGIEHKFIDKFHIYYLDLPSYYYGLTGDSDNKHEFFMLLRAMYYEQVWWVNIARDIDIRYIVVNKELRANTIGGAEYLRDFEKFLIPELDRRDQYVTKLFENKSYALYEMTDLPQSTRVPLFIDTDWNRFIQILSRNPELTRYYDLRYPMMSADLTNYDQLSVLADDPHAARLDLYIKRNPETFAKPNPAVIAFRPDLISSAYYLSPMFRLFQFFSDSKWNRLNMITPGLWGTINGSFLGLPRPTDIRMVVNLPVEGEYRLLMRGAATVNEIDMKSTLFPEGRHLSLRALPDHVAAYDKTLVFTANRKPIDLRTFSPAEAERLIPDEIVALNNQYAYFDMGTVSGTRGKKTIYMTKRDGNPLLVEGVLAIPEDEYRNLQFPDNVRLIAEQDLCCRPLLHEGETP